MSSNQEEIEEPRKKQFTLGLILEEIGQNIQVETQDFCVQVRKYLGAKLSSNKFMADMLNTFGHRIDKWLLTGLSYDEATREAKIIAIKKRVMKDGINKFMADYMEKLAAIMDQSFQRLLEEHWDDIVAYFSKVSEEDTDE